MALHNYAELQTEVAAQLKRSDLTARIPVYIQLAEAHLNRELRSRSMQASATVTPSTSVKTVALPTGWMETIAFTDDLGEPVEAVTLEELRDLSYAQGSSRPRYYCITTLINFERTADQAYSYTMDYWKRLDLATDTTNTVLTNSPDIYLYAALAHAAIDIKDDARIGQWAALAQQALREQNHQEKRTRRALRTDFVTRSFNILRGY